MSKTLALKTSNLLGKCLNRRGFMRKSAIMGSALVVAPGDFILRPKSAYAAICNCSNMECDCQSACCSDPFSAFCCEITGHNACPPGAVYGGWWKVNDSRFCGGDEPQPRYYLDCHNRCDACGCNGQSSCNEECSGTICTCANGNCNSRKTGCSRFRYGQCHQELDCLGPIICRVVTCTPPWQLDSACGTTALFNEETRSHHAPCLEAPSGPIAGSVESVTVESDKVAVGGWVASLVEDIKIEIELDDKRVAVITPEEPRLDAAIRTIDGGRTREFETLVVAADGSRRVCAYASFANGRYLLGCHRLEVSNGKPIGQLVQVSGGRGVVNVTGWAANPGNLVDPVEITIYLNNAPESRTLADRNRSDIFFGYGFEVDVPVEAGHHFICVYAANSATGTKDTLLGCQLAVVS